MKKKWIKGYRIPILLSKKSFLVMRLTFLLTVMLSVSTWATGVAQEAKVSLRMEDASLEEIILELREQTGVRFFYSIDKIKAFSHLSVDAEDENLRDVLDRLLEGTGLTYTLLDDVVVIKDAAAVVAADSIRKTVIKGRVKDEKKQPLPGVTVLVKGLSLGTATNADGSYSMTLPGMDSLTLVFSFVGYETQEIKYDGQDSINVVLKETSLEMEDVIVTGYATIDRGSYVGAVTQVKAEDIMVAGEATIDQMLQGQIPGMSVINRTGKVGGTPKIRVRGTSTLMGNQEPLWVVDGVIQTDPFPIPDDASPLSTEMDDLRETAGNAISWLNPMDIETITVLKDASATAIYGSQAANGVIVITTKKAKGSGLSISYNGSFSVGQKPHYRLYDMMNSQEYMRFSQELWEDRNSWTSTILNVGYAGLMKRFQAREITREEFVSEFRKMENMNTDWFDLLFRNSFSHNHSVSISSGGEKLSSRFSVGANRTLGEAEGNDMLSLTVSANNTFRLKERLTISLQLNGNYRQTHNFAYGVSPYGFAMNTTRAIPMYDENGDLHYYEKSGRMSYSFEDKYFYNYNIINERDNTGTKTDAITFQTSLNVRYKFLKDFEIQGSASYSLASNAIKSWATEYSNYIANIRGYDQGQVIANSAEQHASILPFGGLLQQENAYNRNWSIRAALLYNKNFKEKHRLTLNLGFEALSNIQEGKVDLRYGYLYYRGEKFATVPTEVTPVKGLYTNSQDLHEEMRSAASITNTKSNTLSEYFTAVYGYDERYVLNLNMRLDASNRFGQDKNKRFNPSFSLGAKWRIGNEPFMAWASSWYDMFDISFAYGWSGNAVTAVSPYMIATDGGLDSYSQQYTLKLKSLPYPDLGWEKTEDWNLGIDFSFFKGRLGAGIGIYNKLSHVLASREVPVENGVVSAYIEGTTMGNRGYDLYVSATPIRTENFTWSLSFNTSKVRNKLDNNERENTRDDYLEGSAIVEGEAYGTFWSFAFDGLNPENGYPMFKNMDIEPTNNDLDYLVKAGCSEPDISGGLSMSLRYKKLHLRTTFAMSFGAQTYLPRFFASSGAPNPDQNAPRYLFDRWRKPGDEKKTNIPAIPGGNPNETRINLPLESNVMMSLYDMYNQSDIRVANMDFIRCRSLQLQWYLPTAFLKQLKVRQASISASLSNPFFIAFDKEWEGRDPETADWPARRTVSCSLSVVF